MPSFIRAVRAQGAPYDVLDRLDFFTEMNGIRVLFRWVYAICFVSDHSNYRHICQTCYVDQCITTETVDDTLRRWPLQDETHQPLSLRFRFPRHGRSSRCLRHSVYLPTSTVTAKYDFRMSPGFGSTSKDAHGSLPPSRISLGPASPRFERYAHCRAGGRDWIFWISWRATDTRASDAHSRTTAQYRPGSYTGHG